MPRDNLLQHIECRWRRAIVAIVALAAIVIGTSPTLCGQAAGRPKPHFEDVTRAARLRFRIHQAQALPGLFTSEQSRYGAGAAVTDYDRDGDFDIYFVDHFGHRNRLYRNNGDRTFTDVTDAAGVGDRGWGHMALFLDLDDDGFDDLLVLNDAIADYNTPPTSIYRNRGDGTFELKADAGVTPVAHVIGGATASDYDHDGDLDIYIGTWWDSRSYFYRNDGNFIFTNVTYEAGLTTLPTIVEQWSPVFLDLDGDGWQDLFCAVDFLDDFIFINNHDGTFTHKVTNYHRGNDMGVAVSDVDGDGDLDLYTTNITDSTIDPVDCCNWLYVNNGAAEMNNEAPQYGIQDTFWGWGTAFFDADLDADEDLMAVNGWFQPYWNDRPANFFLNNGSGAFEEAAARVGLAHRGDSRGLVPFDFDLDGDVDVLITNVLATPNLYENRTPRDGRHYLRVQLEGTTSNRNGIGARIYVEHGQRTQMRELFVGGSFYSGLPLEAHFGLGIDDRVDRIRIVWPTGVEQGLNDVAADRVLLITEP